MMDDKYQKLVSILQGYGSALVAFSGGSDSTFLAAVCRDVLKDRCCAATIQHMAHRDKEIAEAEELARYLGLKHRVIDAVEETRGIFETNGTDRCYRCKSAIGRLLQAQAQAWGLSCICDASQMDDLSQARPGMRAIQELSIRTPLIEAGFNKEEIRACSRLMGLPTADKPASPCLATRFTSTQPVTDTGMHMITAAEDYLTGHGYREVRVRLDRNMARIEVRPEDIGTLCREISALSLVQQFKSLGFTHILLDLEGYHTGLKIVEGAKAWI